ncbi:N terminus of Rad21 / Rec8 like protein [Nakaseomyces glabratus]|nr:N terminus of Rad21 / Rec8 like protein [Nakaseomyces glabratus]
MAVSGLPLLKESDPTQYDSVAKVWLLATLSGGNGVGGYRIRRGLVDSRFKKKDILNISIPKTCKVISRSNEALPLRQVSNLLYGVTICYNKKAEFILNDLNAMLAQLQRRLLLTNTGKSTVTVRSTVANNSTLINLNSNKFLLRDDPLFKIDFVKNFSLDESEKQLSDAQTIRKQDYINELGGLLVPTQTNSYQNVNLKSRLLNRPYTIDSDDLEELPVDESLNLNLEFDDIMSESEKTELGINSINKHIDLDINKLFPSDKTSLLGAISEETFDYYHNDEEAEEDSNLKDEDTLEQPPRKKLKPKNVFSFVKIKYDDRISISNEQIRRQQELYKDHMAILQRKVVDNSGKKLSTTYQLKPFEDLIVNSKETDIMIREKQQAKKPNELLTSLNDLFSIEEDIERGRRASSDRQSSKSRSQSLRSEEIGRRVDSSKILDNSTADNENSSSSHLMINLEQIDEDYETNDNSSEFSETDRHNFLNLDLQVPPSSSGRPSSSIRDIVDILESNTMHPRIRPRQYTTDSERIDEHSIYTSELNNIESTASDQYPRSTLNVLDIQAKRFYDFLKQRMEEMGTPIANSARFKNKLSLEYIIPGRKAMIVDDGHDGHVEIVSKSIAANVFFSLLTLATQNLVGLKQRHQENMTQGFMIPSSSDIIVYA